ncbi:MAG: ATPase domain-containing protein [Chloroflexia bacterium]
MSGSPQSMPFPRVPTNVPGLDAVLEGGFPRGGIYLVEGLPGAGKTILGNQLCFNHVAAGGRALFLTLLTEPHARMLSFMRPLAFYDDAAVGAGLQYLSGLQALEHEGLGGFLTLVRASIRERRVTLLVIDGLNTAAEAAPTGLSLGRFLAELQLTLEALGSTAILLGRPNEAADTPLHTMVDGVLSLSTARTDGRGDRVLRVRKLRGSSFLEGLHSYRIGSDGVVVYPRTEELYDPLAPGDPAAQATILPFGVPRLDEMLAGGALLGSNTLIFGAPGTGKTLLGLQFLYSGAEIGDPGVLCGCQEAPGRLLAAAENIGLKLRSEDAAGRLSILWEPPREQPIDAIAERLLAEIERIGARRLVIDGIDVLRHLVPPERFPLFLSGLLGELRRRGVTTVVTLELPQFFGPEVRLPIDGLAALFDTILFLRTVELNSQLYRLVTVLKARERAADRSIREFRISDSGIDVAETFASAEAILTGVARPLAPMTAAMTPGRGPARPEDDNVATTPRR